MKILNRVLDCLFPNDIKCAFCGEDLEFSNRYCTCQECLKKITFNNGKMCQKCGKPLINHTCVNCLHTKHFFKLARAPLVLDGIVRKAIHDFKFNNLSSLATIFAEYMYDEYSHFNVKFDAIVAVPLHVTRLKKRGYNQAHELVKALNKRIKLEDLSDCVIRCKNTVSQTGLNRDERVSNVSSAFKVVDNKFKGKTILLVDDVVTTMSTVNAVSKVLIESGTSSVYVLSIAHG